MLGEGVTMLGGCDHDVTMLGGGFTVKRCNKKGSLVI